MVQFIVGDKGMGKTRYLLDQANTMIKEASGNVVYLDKSAKKMYELNNRIRLIDVSSFPLRDSSEFIGFICGIISQDHDLEKVYVDSFFRVARIDESDMETLEKAVAELEGISGQFGVDFIISIALDKEALPASVQERTVVAL